MLPSRGPAARILGAVVRAEAPPSVRPVSPPGALRVSGSAQGHSVSIELLADVLWVDDQPRDPPAQLAVIMSRLRSVLGAARISHSDAGYALHADWVDLTAASELQSEADRRLREHEPAPVLAAAAAARALLAHPPADDEGWP